MILITILFLPSVALAQLTMCKPEKDTVGSVKAIGWDLGTGRAKITDDLNKTFEGKVTLTREHSGLGLKVNVYVKYDAPYYGADAAEYIVFPVQKDDFRIIAVGYIFKGGKQYLTSSSGSVSAICISA